MRAGEIKERQRGIDRSILLTLSHFHFPLLSYPARHSNTHHHPHGHHTSLPTMIIMRGLLVLAVAASLASAVAAATDDINAFFGNATDSPPVVALSNETRSDWELYKGELF